MRPLLTIAALLLAAAPVAAQSIGPASPTASVPAGASTPCVPFSGCLVVADFEQFEAGGLPIGWLTYENKRDVRPVTGELQTDEERFVVASERGNRFIRALVYGKAHRIILPNDGEKLDWDVDSHPLLSWDWRALKLPVGARENMSRLNDTGAAIYVVFDEDWLGRPRTIKYSYSSSLPKGQTASYGALRVLVVSSQVEEGIERWIPVRRDVQQDYRDLFGKEPPSRPSAIFLWSDSDSVDSEAEVDFDNLRIHASG
ncbi:MAG: DUF3047 domain-containing protein [Rhodothermales bacterium]|nr:DUF3047 domain-containing protein [Rhodothermales bacterium]MBO6778092.1 DUF3047 domain-containing protein [Rhodothermales bacterium]